MFGMLNMAIITQFQWQPDVVWVFCFCMHFQILRKRTFPGTTALKWRDQSWYSTQKDFMTPRSGTPCCLLVSRARKDSTTIPPIYSSAQSLNRCQISTEIIWPKTWIQFELSIHTAVLCSIYTAVCIAILCTHLYSVLSYLTVILWVSLGTALAIKKCH